MAKTSSRTITRSASAPTPTDLHRSSSGSTPTSTLPATRLISMKMWNTRAPPPVESVKGHYLPKALVNQNRLRRITVETYMTEVDPKKSLPKGSAAKPSPSRSKSKSKSLIKEYKTFLRILGPVSKSKSRRTNRSGGQVEPHDDMSMSSDGYNSIMPDASTPMNQLTWHEKYKYNIQDIVVNKRVGDMCTVTTSTIKKSVTRDFFFERDVQAKEFYDHIEDCKRLIEKSIRDTIGRSLNGNKDLNLLIEVISGVGLASGDLVSSDPYVVIRMGTEEVHRTKFISKTLDPIWTVTTGALCLLKTTPQDLFRCADGICFEVRDYDAVGKGSSLGGIFVPPKMMIDASGERLEFDIKPMPGKKVGKGKLSLRCRHATEHDIEFMEALKKQMDTKNMKATLDSDSAKKPNVAGSLKKTAKSLTVDKFQRNTHTDQHGVVRYRVRPQPDPTNIQNTEWLTEDEINTIVYEESRQWVDAGSGDLGTIYIEVIGCDDMPNLDTGGYGNKTDSFISLTYEDVVAKTDVINDCLSPKWLPWTTRAFVFHMAHVSSRIFIGAFDNDDGFYDNHDLVGRVAIDITNFTPKTVYILKYDLFTSGAFSKRKSKGTITVRLRFELESERTVLFSALKPPEQFYVNVKTKKDHHVVRNKINGKYNMQEYGMRSINSYIEEILTYRHLLLYLQDALIQILLWRNSYYIRLTNSVTLGIPLNSINTFLGGIALVEHPSLLPSLSFLCFGWFLLSTMGIRQRNPNPWDHSKTFVELLRVCILGKSGIPPMKISKNENLQQCMEYKHARKERIRKAEEYAKKKAEKYTKLQAEFQKELDDVGDARVESKGVNVSVDPMKPILYPVQKNLGIVCDVLRVVKNVVIWEECYYSFWLTLGSFVIGIACLFVPWRFITLWTCRVVVWLLFGPWMKLLDIFWYRKVESLTDEEIEKLEQENAEKQGEKYKEIVKQARINRENAKKMKEMKKYMFGKFITNVPVFKLDRFRDIPLPQSTATPYKQKQISMAELAMQEAGKNRVRIPGQQLEGQMIPVGLSFRTIAPKGQPTRHQSMMLREGATANLSTESNFSARVKVGSVLLVSLALTWFGVPIMISSVRWITVHYIG